MRIALATASPGGHLYRVTIYNESGRCKLSFAKRKLFDRKRQLSYLIDHLVHHVLQCDHLHSSPTDWGSLMASATLAMVPTRQAEASAFRC
jgi:hypothetical protein